MNRTTDAPYETGPGPELSPLYDRRPHWTRAFRGGSAVVSDEELEAHITRLECGSLADGPPDDDLERRIEAIDRASRSIHAEFARQGAVLERQDVAADRTLDDRLAAVERRLVEVERVLREGIDSP